MENLPIEFAGVDVLCVDDLGHGRLLLPRSLCCAIRNCELRSVFILKPYGCLIRENKLVLIGRQVMVRQTRNRSPRGKDAYARKPHCGNFPRPVPQLPSNVTSDPLRTNAILLGSAKWMNGTVL